MSDYVFEATKVPMPGGRDEGYASCRELGGRLQADLDPVFGQDYQLAVDEDIDEDDDEITWTLKIQRGLRIGVEVDIEWTPGESHAEVDVTQFSKLDNTLGVGFCVLVALVFGICAIVEIPPFDVLPGRKLAAIIAAVGGLIVGVIVYLIALRPLSRVGVGSVNDALEQGVGERVQKALEAEAGQRGHEEGAIE